MPDAYRRHFDGPYADFWKDQALRYGHDAGHQRLIDLVASKVPPGGLLVDCGMGNGFPFTLAWSRTLRVMGTDLSGRALALARPGLSGGAGARLAVGALEALPFRSGSADVAVSARTMKYLPRLFAGLEELWRIARPGGWIVFDAFNQDHSKGRRGLLRLLLGSAPGEQHAVDVGKVKAWLEARGASVSLHDDQGYPLAGEPGATVWFLARIPS